MSDFDNGRYLQIVIGIDRGIVCICYSVSNHNVRNQLCLDDWKLNFHSRIIDPYDIFIDVKKLNFVFVDDDC